MIKDEQRYETEELAKAAAAEKGPEWVAIKTTFVCDPWMIGRQPVVGEYLNHKGYSDMEPHKIVRMSPSGKTAWVRRVEATLDPTWKPEFQPGGFVGHCTNQASQRWIYGELAGEEKKVRLSSKGWGKGDWKPATEPRKFHDYNF